MDWLAYPAAALVVAAWAVLRWLEGRAARREEVGRGTPADVPTEAEAEDDGPGPVILRFPGDWQKKAL